MTAVVPGQDEGGRDEAVGVHDGAGDRPVVRVTGLHAGYMRSQTYSTTGYIGMKTNIGVALKPKFMSSLL